MPLAIARPPRWQRLLNLPSATPSARYSTKSGALRLYSCPSMIFAPPPLRRMIPIRTVPRGNSRPSTGEAYH
jgi:hypothetical protein